MYIQLQHILKSVLLHLVIEFHNFYIQMAISACSLGTFGKDCGQVCKGHCKDGCNHVTGKCDKGCEDGWYTENCNIGTNSFNQLY